MQNVNYSSASSLSITERMEILKKDYTSIVEIIKSLDIVEFSYSEWLLKLPEELEQCKYNCEQELEWINYITSKVDSVCDEYILKIKNIDTDFEFNKEFEIK